MVARAGQREPLRTCLGCRRVRPKPELVRLVRADDGTAAVDPSGKAAGRGAYVCPDPGCLARARQRMARALRAERVDHERIAEQLSGMGVR